MGLVGIRVGKDLGPFAGVFGSYGAILGFSTRGPSEVGIGFYLFVLKTFCRAVYGCIEDIDWGFWGSRLWVVRG